MKMDSLQDKVVVITGASSGIGKRAVERFLLEGAKVVMAARTEEAMTEHVNRLNVSPERVLVVKTDVSDYAQVRHLADSALQTFNRIDVWVNNAAVNMYGYVEDLKVEDIRQVIDVNLMGQIHGMKVALDVFKNQHFGNIINVASVFGVAAAPLEAAYAASKHGILGFSCALRQELMTDQYKHMDIEVMDLLPASMDTPFTRHAKSMTGQLPKPMPPIYDPELTVDAILKYAQSPKPMAVVGNSGKLMVMGMRFAPLLTERFMSWIGVPSQQTKEPKPVEGDDNLYTTSKRDMEIYGGFKTTPIRQHLAEYAKRHPVRVAITALVPFFLLLKWMQRRTAAAA